MPSLTCLRARLNSRSRSGSATAVSPLSACVTTLRFIPHVLQNFAPSLASVEQVGQYMDSRSPVIVGRGARRAARWRRAGGHLPGGRDVEGATAASITWMVDG